MSRGRAATLVLLLALGCATLLLPPPGQLATALAVACLCPLPDRAARTLDTFGATARTRGLAAFLLLLIALPANLALGGQLDGHLVVHSDFHTYLVGARVGVDHGWSRLFDVGLQHRAWLASYGGDAKFLPFLNTPPQAWLVTPLLALPYVWAYATWVGLMVAILGVVVALVAPADRWSQAAVLLVAGCAWVVTYSLASGQNAVIGALAIALCWRLMRAERPVLAGIALGLIAIRPNATFLVPIALLLAGERRVFAAWLAASALVGGVIFLSLGTHGVGQFVSLAIQVRRDFPKAVEMTLQQLLGPGPATVALQALLAGVALWTAARLGKGRPSVAICAGVIGSAFLTPYIHVQDYLAFLAAAALLVTSGEREGAGWVVVGLLVVAPPGWLFGSRWPVALVAAELAWLAWLAWPMLRRPGARHGAGHRVDAVGLTGG